MNRIIWLIGPSGSGKDSLLTALRQQQEQQLLVAHRYITRPCDAGGENHVALSNDEFSQRARRGLFALDWEANGWRYAIGIELDLWLASGFDVVVNGSRAHLAQAQERYGPRLVPIVIQVSAQVLEQRLIARGRENSEQIAQRLARAARYDNATCHCRVLNNDGSLQQSVSQLLALIREPAPHGAQENHHVC
ncbi:ribose 1,5-bisphosphokinase [Enterobacteriaceae bacterium 4M9]|nr:ribose 1,5-bisphosphokinase [Enterobacteriaceae bacterium 4M9]